METLNSETERLLEQRRLLTERKLGTLSSAVKSFINTSNMDDKTYLSNKDKLTKDLQETLKTAEDDAYQHYLREIEINNSRTDGTKKSEEAIWQEYQGSLAKIRGVHDQSITDLEEYHMRRSGLQDNFFNKISENKKSIEEEEKRHNDTINEINNLKLTNYDMAITLEQDELARHENFMSGHREKLKGVFEGINLDNLAEWLKYIQTTAEEGGVLSSTQSENVRSFLSTMDGMDEETKKKITQGLKDAGVDIDTLGKSLSTQMHGEGASIMTNFDSGLQSTIGLSKITTQQSMTDIFNIVNGTSLFNPGKNLALTTQKGINAGSGGIDGAIKSIMTNSQGRVKTTDFSPTGRSKSEELARGIKSADGSVWNATTQTANHGRSGGR